MNSFVIIIIGILGAIMTFYVSNQLKQGAVRASALLSLMVGLFLYFFPEILNTYLTENIPIVFAGTSYIGMVSPATKNVYRQLLIAGTLFSLVYINQNNMFNGFGGGLGALAFIALLVTLGGSVGFKKMTKQEKLSSRIPWKQEK